MISAVNERCAGIDLGKRMLVVGLMTGPADQEPTEEIRHFATTTSRLAEMRNWLTLAGCTVVAMERSVQIQ
jgi:hypothetical protein